MKYYAVIALVAAPDVATHEEVYDLVDAQFVDSDHLTVIYRDIDPNWRAFEVLDANAPIEEETA